MPSGLESALIIELKTTIDWSSALTCPDTGALTSFSPDLHFSPLDYQKRDRELEYRDLINASAVAKVSLDISGVWNFSTVRPTLSGATTTYQLPFIASEARQTDGSVFHVKQISIPWDAANTTDRDLYGRDAQAFETLAKAVVEVLDSPSVTEISGITPVTVWSKAEGTNTPADVNSALPLNRDLFKNPDSYLAERDNQIAAYVARIVDILRNPFAHASRLYVKVSGTDARETEVYTLSDPRWTTGKQYYVDDEVTYQERMFQASVDTTSAPIAAGVVSADWTEITALSNRVFVIEPALEDRNRLVYDVAARTLQWFHQDGLEVHPPQIFALSIPGVLPGQTISTITSIPEQKDAQYWRQKAGQLIPRGEQWVSCFNSYNAGYGAEGGLPQTLGADSGGLDLVSAASMPTPGEVTLSFPEAAADVGNYRVSLLVKAQPKVEIMGGHNVSGISGTLGGATLTQNTPVEYRMGLPNGDWALQIQYTNLTGSTDGFHIEGAWNGEVFLPDQLPFKFQDSNGDAYTNGYLVTSDPVSFASDGADRTLALNWLDGTGELHIRKLVFTSSDNAEGRFQMSGSLSGCSGTISDVDILASAGVPDVMTFETVTSGSYYSPTLYLKGTQDGRLPLQILYSDLEVETTLVSTPSQHGFEGFRQEMLDRALESVTQNYALALSYAGTNVPEFRQTGHHWTPNSTDSWMGFIEVWEPRLRQQDSLSYVTEGRQYEVVGNSVVYNSTTYQPGDKFTGVADVTSFTTNSGATVNQIGAFIRSRPGHLGQPALVPDGLEFLSSGTLRQNYDAKMSFPTLQPCQPWMMEAGLYVAQSDFWPLQTI